MDYEDLNEALKAGLESLLTEKSGRVMDLIFGDTLNFNGFVGEFADEDYKDFESLLVRHTAENLYKCVVSNEVIFALAVTKKCVKRPNSVEGIAENISNLYRQGVRYRQGSVVLDDKADAFDFWFMQSGKKESFVKFMKFFDKIQPLFGDFAKITKISADKKMSGREYFRIISKFNKKINDTFAESLVLVDDWGDLGPIFEVLYLDVLNNFRTNARMVEEMKNELPPENVEKPRTPVAPQVNVKEQERLEMIKKANDAYEEFCLDVLRDLEKQYSLSVKDMYHYFVDVKFKKFVERFNMPLANNVSIGVAKDALAQIQGLYNYVQTIKENAYCTSVYPNQKGQ